MGSSSSIFNENSYSASISALDPEIRNRKYGPPPPPFSEEYNEWKARYLYQDGPIMRKIRKESNELRIKILLDIPLEFLQPTIVIIYCPHLSVTSRLINFLRQKLNFSLIQRMNYSSTQEMFDDILFRYEEYNSEQQLQLQQQPQPQQQQHVDQSYQQSYEGIRRGVMTGNGGARKGCLLYNYPTNATEVIEFNDQTMRYRKVVIIFDSHEVMKLSRSLSDQWIHLPSQRLYDDEICPPKTVLLARKSEKAIDQSTYIDDLTSEPLTKV